MKKITAAQEREVLAKAAEGSSADEIAAWLKATHGIQISGRSIRKRLAVTRTERADVAKAVVREVLGKTVVSDLERLEKIRRQVANKAAKLEKSIGHAEDEEGRRTRRALTVGAWLDLKALEVKILDRKLHYAGADTPDDGHADLANAERSLDSELDRLAARERTAPGASADSSKQP